MMTGVSAGGDEEESVAISRVDLAIVACGSKGKVQVWGLTRDGDDRVSLKFRPRSAIWSATFIDDTTLITTERDLGTVHRRALAKPDRRRLRLSGTDATRASNSCS